MSTLHLPPPKIWTEKPNVLDLVYGNFPHDGDLGTPQKWRPCIVLDFLADDENPIALVIPGTSTVDKLPDKSHIVINPTTMNELYVPTLFHCRKPFKLRWDQKWFTTAPGSLSPIGGTVETKDKKEMMALFDAIQAGGRSFHELKVIVS